MMERRGFFGALAGVAATATAWLSFKPKQALALPATKAANQVTLMADDIWFVDGQKLNVHVIEMTLDFERSPILFDVEPSQTITGRQRRVLIPRINEEKIRSWAEEKPQWIVDSPLPPGGDLGEQELTWSEVGEPDARPLDQVLYNRMGELLKAFKQVGFDGVTADLCAPRGLLVKVTTPKQVDYALAVTGYDLNTSNMRLMAPARAVLAS